MKMRKSAQFGGDYPHLEPRNSSEPREQITKRNSIAKHEQLFSLTKSLLIVCP
jgi:hypothetical protein